MDFSSFDRTQKLFYVRFLKLIAKRGLDVIVRSEIIVSNPAPVPDLGAVGERLGKQRQLARYHNLGIPVP